MATLASLDARLDEEFYWQEVEERLEELWETDLPPGVPPGVAGVYYVTAACAPPYLDPPEED